MTAPLCLALALLAISWSAILVRLCGAPALGIAFYRLLFATLGTFPLVWRREEAGRRLTSALSGPAAAAGLCLALHFGSWIRSLDLTSVASSVLLVNLHPLLSGYAGRRWLGDALSGRTVAALVLALLGAGFVAAGDWGSGAGHLMGDLLAIVGAITVSAYLLIGRSLRRRVALGSYLTGVYATATLALGVACWGWGVPLSGYRAADYGWIALMAVGTLCVGAGIAWMAREEWLRQRIRVASS